MDRPRADPRPGRHAWAALLRRVFEIDALWCPRCGSTLRLIAAIEDPDIARKILDCLHLPSRAPPLGRVTSEGDPLLSPEPAPAPEAFLESAADEALWGFDQSPDFEQP